MAKMKYTRERAQDVFQEMMPLLEAHWKEIAHYQDIPLDVDFETYFKCEDAGLLRVFTARDEEEILVGYAVFMVKANIHYRSSLQALQDVLYIDKERRGFGAKFILWCDQQLRNEGVQVVMHHLKAAHNFGSMLERIGYQLQDLIYTKRLDKQK